MAFSTLPRRLAVALTLLCCSGALKAESPHLITVSSGEPLNLDQYLGEGKTLVVGFFSRFSPGCPCGPCTAVANPLAALQAAREDLQVVVVDIDRAGATQIDWNSPVAMQFGVRRLPHFLVFGPNGRLLHQDDPQRKTDAATQWVHHLIESMPVPDGSRAVAAMTP